MKAKLALLMLVVLFTVPLGGAKSPEPVVAGGGEACRTYAIAKIVGVIEGGQVTTCTSFPLAVQENKVFDMEGTVSTPAETGTGFTVDVDIVINSEASCFVVGNVVGENTLTAGGVIHTEAFTMNMGEGEPCFGYWDMEVTTVGGDVYNQFIAFFIVRDIGTSFEERLDQTAPEFFGLVILILVSLFFWMRTNDIFLPYVYMLLVTIPALIWLTLFIDSGERLLFGLSTIAFIIAAYIGIRTGYDQLVNRGGTNDR